MTALLTLIEGTIQPFLPGPPCCSNEYLFNRLPEINLYPDEIQLDIETVRKEDSRLQENYPDGDGSPSHWKSRAILKLALARGVVSLCFIPKDTTKCHTLFVQNRSLLAERVGFYAPYLEREYRQKLGAIEQFPCIPLVKPELVQELLQQTLPPPVAEESWAILDCFLKDPSTIFLAMTFLDQSGPLTIGWVKV